MKTYLALILFILFTGKIFAQNAHVKYNLREFYPLVAGSAYQLEVLYAGGIMDAPQKKVLFRGEIPSDRLAFTN